MTSMGLPIGFRDALFEEAKARRSIEDTLAGVFEQRGFREIIPSSVEFLELYMRGNQAARDHAYRFLDREDNLLALRADFTPAVARIVSTRLASAEPPVKVWYAGNVFRKVDPRQGRYSETTQIGAELIGVHSTASDAELIAAAMLCLSKLGIESVQLHINHAGILSGIVDAAVLDHAERDQVKSQLDRKDMHGLAAKLEELGVRREIQAQLHALSRLIGGEEVVQQALRSIDNERSRSALKELQSLAALLASWKAQIVYDLTEVDEMEYYTGVMFKMLSSRLRTELGGGGRYDTLLREFGTPIPAVGFSFSLENLVELV
jgi:ATP phosphoribosyltransferase regulatory subunit